MKNVVKILLITVIYLIPSSLFAQTTNTGNYSTQVISADGKTSTWTFIKPSSQVTVPANAETEDNGIIYVPSGGSKMKFSSSNQFSWQGQSSGYIPVPAGGAGTISMTVAGQSDSRHLQLYVNGTAAGETKRLYSKASSDGNITSDGKRGPQSFQFTSSDLTTKGGKTYLHFKDNNSEMKIATITVALTTGSYTAAGPVISTDATLSALTYNGTSVPNFSATTTNYEVELPAGTTTPPTVAATKNDTKASDPVITQATSLPGNATVTVTAEDGTTTKTYTITFTVASSAPKVTSATWDNIAGAATIDQANKTITGKVAQGSGLTAITPDFTGNNISSWTPQGAQNFTNSPINYTFTNSATGETTTYAVTITEVPLIHPTGVTLDKSSLSIQIGGTAALTATVQPSDATNQNVTWESSNTAIATVNNGQVKGIAAGSATITVKTVDGEKTATCSVTVTAAPPVPSTDLAVHVPEIYEAKDLAGGYNTPLVVDGGREYEVYYMTRDGESDFCIATTSADKNIGITNRSTEFSVTAKDGWFKFSATGWSSASDAMGGEFGAVSRRLDMDQSCEFLMHISGFDQFAIVAKDKKKDTSSAQNKPGDNKYLEVYIDDVLQPQQFNTSASIRRYDISSAEHVIRIKHIGEDKSSMYAFSLRLAQEPRTKWVKGNDSTQVVYQTGSINPITYSTKYNNIPGAKTDLVWDGPEATGIGLTQHNGTLSDTLILSGQANCQVGTYKYHIVAHYNGAPTNSVSGKFIVKSSIAARSELDALAYTGEEMDQIIFAYYALSANEVQLTWPNGQPAGISGSGNNGRYIIGGTPTAASGTYPYAITTVGGDTTFTGTISVITPNYGPKSVMYLCKNAKDYSKDAIYQALNGTGSNQWDLFPRKQKENGPRPTEQYANYKWILISEDADADNLEVLSIIQGGANLPVLSMKGFTYAQGRLNWGEPNNGAIDTTLNTKNKGTKLYIEQPSHPIFAQLGSSLKKGDSIQILSNYELNGIMPVDVKLPGTYCLATAYTRDINDYYKNGELQTALHEVPANMRGGHKYICLPLAKGVTFTPQGKNLLNGIISYLLSPDQATVATPELQINSFELLGVKATINQSENTISLALTEEQSAQLEGAEPTIKIADEANTHVTTSAVPLQYALYTPKIYVVTDYINRRAYSLTIDVYDPEGIENVYEAGEWVNIYDIYGRKVATTNENIYTMDLPRGMYIIVTESGETLKIMR